MPPAAANIGRSYRARTLLAYDLLLLRGAFAQHFARPLDRVILFLLIVLGVYLLEAQLRAIGAGLDAWTPMAVLTAGLLAGMTTSLHVERRLAELVESAILLPEALTPRVRRGYALGHHLLGLMALSGMAAALARHAAGPPLLGSTVAAIAGYMTGGLGAAALMRWSRWYAWVDRPRPGTGAAHETLPSNFAGIVQQLQIRPLPPRLDPIVVALGAGAVIAAICLIAAEAIGLAAGLATEILLLGGTAIMLSRVDYRLLHFSRFAGIGVAACLFQHLALAAIACVAVSLFCAPLRPALTIASVVIGLAVLWLRGLMLLLYAQDAQKSADARVQLEMAAPIMLGLFFAPLGVVLAIGRLIHLYRRSMRCRWDIG